jgi:hypothetical protein
MLESDVIFGDYLATGLLKAAGADIVTLNITFGGAEGEVAQVERSLVPRDRAVAVAGAVQLAWKGSSRAPQVVGSKEGSGKVGDDL